MPTSEEKYKCFQNYRSTRVRFDHFNLGKKCNSITRVVYKRRPWLCASDDDVQTDRLWGAACVATLSEWSCRRSLTGRDISPRNARRHGSADLGTRPRWNAARDTVYCYRYCYYTVTWYVPRALGLFIVPGRDSSS